MRSSSGSLTRNKARLADMVNVSESSINVMMINEPNKLLGSSQNGTRGSIYSSLGLHGYNAHGGETRPKSVVLQQRNEVSPITRLPKGRQADRKER